VLDWWQARQPFSRS